MQEFKFLEEEHWYGGYVNDGIEQPYTSNSDCKVDLSFNDGSNQMVDFFISNKGRLLYKQNNELEFIVEFSNGTILASDSAELLANTNEQTLATAYALAKEKCFSKQDIKLAKEFFETPIYNSWIELTFNQNQKDIIRYAKDNIKYSMPAGILMIDDGWSDYYGKWKFSVEKFPKPQEMINELNSLGYKIMLWICPFITADTFEYRELAKKDFLLKDSQGEIYISNWWNGHSAVLDLLNKDAKKWLETQLEALIEDLGVAGFKFDAGDIRYYPHSNTDEIQASIEQSNAWRDLCSEYSFNELRAATNAAGMNIMERLADKDHSWDNKGIASLIPNSITASMMGHTYSSPDMIGGGEYLHFYNVDSLDEEIFVRWAQIAAFMPVMQFSAAPYRVLSENNQARINKAINLRLELKDYIMEIVETSFKEKSPIVAPIEFYYPEIKEKLYDQFCFGKDLIIAPITTANTNKREVFLPRGKWENFNTKEIIDIEQGKFVASSDDLPIYKQIK
ncbi:glycoside hydrolase family 31 protein [Fastidiosipila sanguinis]|uniref:Glycosyl hydrolase family 31 n=1 Tax=Fastidiosipila sanguinis TaxID=236753 RepID=A0A2S0KNS5_9FIRM|nr:glycoside hydrolase family 31 protein [Fastidiosipila sanguinis]AVM42673.1 glycosyl hydrolase family 31 [Fastidiosipila sanguinis]